MGIVRNRLARRFGVIGLLSDLALVGAAASRLAQRRNGTGKASVTELALAGGAALRLLGRLRRRRRAKRAVTVAA